MTKQETPKFDLEERTAQFGEAVILFAKELAPAKAEPLAISANKNKLNIRICLVLILGTNFSKII